MEEDIKNKKDSDKKPNCDHKPWIYSVLVAVVAAVLVGGGVYYFMNQNYESEKGELATQIKNGEMATKECKSEKEVCEKEKEDLLEGDKNNIYSYENLYRSFNLGVEFAFRPAENSFVYEKENVLKILQNKKISKENCTEDSACYLVLDNPYFLGVGEITIFNKSSEESINEAIEKLIKKEGKDPTNCDIKVKDLDNNKKEISVEYKNLYEPLETNDVSAGLVHKTEFEKEANEICSRFVQGPGPGAGGFIYNPVESEIVFAYIYSQGLDALDIQPESIRFIQ
jgi:hypothetical protein